MTCLDEAGKDVGHLVVSAGKGNVVSHEGFTAEPGVSIEKPETQASSSSDSDDSNDRARRHAPPRKSMARTATPAPEKKDVFGRIGNSLSKFFTGH